VKPAPQIPVAVFITSFHPGGTERQMTELIQRLDRDRFDVHVACFHREGAWLPRVEACAPITEFPIRGFARPATVARAATFARWCRTRRIAVLQSCDLYANTFALPAAALAGVAARIGSRRELNPDKSPGQITLQRQAYRCAHAVVANSNAAGRQLESEGLASGRIRIIANGVSIERFAPHAAARPLSKILTVANLRQEKAHEVLLAAAARLAPRYPHLTFDIAGGGPRLSELRELARTLNVADRVAFLGHREDVPALLAEADAFVLPSRSEAFPNGAIEAMAAGLPVVASATGGLLDLIDNGRTGVLVQPDDPNALAQALEGLILSPARASAIGAAARDEITRRYSFDRMVRAFEDLYLSQLGTPRGISLQAA
jgi:glycosyltransferase involved in cell wall biosynthesis